MLNDADTTARQIFICRSQEDTEMLGRAAAALCSPGSVFSLRGSLGAGKTVFARGFARQLGITEAVVSPTFTLIQEYSGSLPLYHMDLYRITSEEDFIMTGGEDMLYSRGVCLIEWSEVINELLPEDTVYVNISIEPDGSRTVEIRNMKKKIPENFRNIPASGKDTGHAAEENGK